MSANFFLGETKPLGIPPVLFDSPIDLPEKRAGALQIKHTFHEAGEEVMVVGPRQALLRGCKAYKAHLPKPRRMHHLVDDVHGTWMTDLPEELFQIAEMLVEVNPRGNVLVGGLGLGILARTLCERKSVKRVVVVERSREVIDLCGFVDPKLTIVNLDIVSALSVVGKGEYSHFLLDTWQGTNEMTWWREVFPQRRLIRQHCGRSPKIHCWAEDIMAGQIMRMLTISIAKPGWYYEGLPNLSEHEARRFVYCVGEPWWEKRYGKIVDAAIEKTEDRKQRKEKQA